MKKYAIASCLWALSSMAPALAQVSETSPPVPAVAQESPQQWEYKFITNQTHISGTTWEEDGARMSAPASGWLNTFGAQGWELFDVEVVANRDTFGNPYTNRYFYFRRQVRSAG